MLKIKLRFKKAMFAFFQNEILESFGTDKSIKHIQHVCKEMKMTEIISEINLDQRSSESYGIPINGVYEKALAKARTDLFEESMKYIQIDEKSVVDPYFHPIRKIRLRLFVGIPDKY